MKNVTVETFAAEVLSSPRPVLVDFWAEWCGPCKALAPTLEKLDARFKDDVTIVKVNVDENKALSPEYDVRGIPMLLLVKDGKEIARVVGSRSLKQLTTFLSEQLGLAVEEDALPEASRSAYHGDPQLKRSRLAALRAHIENKRADSQAPMWDDEHIYDALQFVAQKPDLEDCAAALGMSTSLVFAVSSLSSYFGTLANAAQYELDWLELVPPGADLTTLPGRLLVAILRSDAVTAFVKDHADLWQARDILATLHENDIASEVPATEWASLQQQLAAIAETDDWERHTLAGLLKDLARSIRRDDSIVRNAIGSIAVYGWRKIKHEYGWADAEDRVVLNLFEKIHQCMLDETGTFDRDRMVERAAKEEPELIARFHRQYEDGHARVTEIGKSFAQMLLEMTKALA